MIQDKVIQTFNTFAADYEHSVDHSALYNCEYERPTMMECVPKDLPNKNVLDAGCAAGWYAQQFVNLGAHVTAIDVSPEMIEATKRRVGDTCTVMCADLSAKLPFEDDTFDFIVSSLTLHYIQDWDTTFQEFSRVLKKDGTFLFSVHHPMMDQQLSPSDVYFNCELVKDTWKKGGKSVDVYYYRRPLQVIINDTIKHFTFSRMVEPTPTENFKKQNEESYQKLMKTPAFLIIEAKNDKGRA
ncbi:class I SAM-dependent methyltransferase [Priestia taiwanensis]|uniref:Ubiquinone biosynthesis methyltransferase UbiE n=1 Tax=Priestia taiwanensis TaxID=1347902 RepID=A0A917AM18_9BACI|nr:class I SAM-dependent methyltransferase [Priestia taiwanensis]MBM7362183.1 ubiquinone/menaquinone biosynthesis C-methylase UbiE [Priestia taiwanensis]GGE60036.1 ubiquinone biosynthesis methyltransferase UbiE [Priestia taiwanensis]